MNKQISIAIICNSDTLVIPTIFSLIQNNSLKGVGILRKNKRSLFKPIINTGLTESHVALFDKENWELKMADWLLDLSIDVVFVFGFPWKIPQKILNLTKYGFYNFHYGLLPKYKGADPIFWQLKNKENNCGLVVHKMTDVIDEGPILFKKEFPITPGENYAMLCQKLGFETPAIIPSVLEKLVYQKELKKQGVGVASIHIEKPTIKDLTIDWESQKAEDIEWLINACNPKYGGAVTFLKGKEFRILEASPVEMAPPSDAFPGKVVYADNLYGLIVACKDNKFLRINIVHVEEGYLSGSKLFNFGIRTGINFN